MASEGKPSSAPRPHYSENASIFPLEGGCACGQVRYRLAAPPLIVHCCHCTLCQRETGSAFAMNAIIESNNVSLLSSTKPTVPFAPTKPAEVLPCGPPLAQQIGASVIQPNMINTPSESGFGQVYARCPTCGIAVWSHYAGGGDLLTYIRVGTLDRAWEVAPDVHIFMGSKRDFVALDDGKPQFEVFYPSRESVYRKDALERFSKLEADILERRAELRKAGPRF